MVRNTHTGQLIEHSLEKFEEVDLEEGNIEWGEYMRLRVTLDITKPLSMRKKLTIDKLDSF